MGGGNGCKSAKARERALEKKAKDGKGASQLKANAKAQNIVCTVCKQPFMCTANEAQLRQHAESRHPTVSAHTCFPDKIPE